MAILGKSGASITLTPLPKTEKNKTCKMPRLFEQIGLLVLQRPVQFHFVTTSTLHKLQSFHHYSLN